MFSPQDKFCRQLGGYGYKHWAKSEFFQALMKMDGDGKMNLARPNPIKFLFWNGLYWLVYFQAARFIFLMWHFEKFHILSSRDVSGIVFWGLKMDLAAMSWLSLVPFLVLLGSPNWRRRLILKIHGVLFIVTLTLIHICDLEIFRFWGCRMDSSALRYLKTPLESTDVV